MNDSIFWRLAWKEYRTQRSFWISVVVLTLFLELLALLSASMVDNTHWAVGGSKRVSLLFGLALAFPALYALGCGATLFSTEHETGTFEFQRMLPVSVGRLFWGKLFFPVASTLVMIGLLWPAAIGFAGGHHPSRDVTLGLWALGGFGAVELLVWGVFFSLLSHQPLKATMLAMGSTSVCVHLITAHYISGAFDYFHLEFYLAAMPPRAAVVLLVAVADVWLGLRWFRENGPLSTDGAILGKKKTPQATQAAGQLDERAAAIRKPDFGRLAWQAWRQSRSTIGLFWVLAIPLVYSAVLLIINEHQRGHRGSNASLEPFCLLVVPLLSAAGACVFLADRRRGSYRFLAERGVGSRRVWLSRQLVWIPLAVVWAIAILASFLLAGYNDDSWRANRDPMSWRVAMLFFAFFPAIGYTAGQFCSMCLRSGILAVVFGWVLTGVLLVWTGFMVVVLGAPFLWFVLPIPLVLLLATWVRAPHWLHERNTLRSWLPTGLVLAVPTLMLMVALPCYRIYEIPVVDPGFALEDYARPCTPEQAATANLYQQSHQAWTPSPREISDERNAAQKPTDDSPRELSLQMIAWLEANEKATRLAMQASEQTACVGFNSSGFRQNLIKVSDLASKLIFRGGRAGNVGQTGRSTSALSGGVADIETTPPILGGGVACK